MINSNNALTHWIEKTNRLEHDAHSLLKDHELSRSRIIEIHTLFLKTKKLYPDVQNYFIESIDCLKNDMRRASIILSWAGFIFIFTENLYKKFYSTIVSIRPKWDLHSTKSILENHREHQIIELAKAVGMINKAKEKKYIGQLSTRNECAHPTLESPTRNVAIAFVESMIVQSTNINE